MVAMYTEDALFGPMPFAVWVYYARLVHNRCTLASLARISH